MHGDAKKKDKGCLLNQNTQTILWQLEVLQWFIISGHNLKKIKYAGETGGQSENRYMLFFYAFVSFTFYQSYNPNEGNKATKAQNDS